MSLSDSSITPWGEGQMAMENGRGANMGELYLKVIFQETINTNKNILYSIAYW